MSEPVPAYSALDYQYMARALYLAGRSLNSCDPNPRVGCVVVADGRVVGEAWHRRAGEPHAEILALQQAGDRAKSATAYVSLEPCCHTGRTGPCTEALIVAGISRVIFAATDPNPRVAGAGRQALSDAGIDVSGGLLADQAQQINRGFFSRMQRGRPFVCSKIAMSLDGRTALANGHSKWITSDASRADVQRLRARASAILTGSGTLTADNPRLTVRLDNDERWQPPPRVVLDSMLVTPPDARIVSDDAPTLIFAAANAPQERAAALLDAGAQVERAEYTGNGLDLHQVLETLASRGCNELLVEAGPCLNGALLQAGLLDELIVYQAPHLLGPAARPMFDIPELTAMDKRPGFRLLSTRRIGNDWRMRFLPLGAGH